jgi:hypothetical protein
VRDEVEEELSFHLEMKVRDLIASGVDPSTARHQAEQRGNPTRLRAALEGLGARRNADMERSQYLGELRQDIAFAARQLFGNPGFTAIAVLTLALGIGATTAIFSVVDAVLLRPLPFGDPARLVALWEDGSSFGFPKNTPAPGNYADWTRLGSLSGAAALDIRDYNLTGDGRPEKVGAAGTTTVDFTPYASLAANPVRTTKKPKPKPSSS